MKTARVDKLKAHRIAADAQLRRRKVKITTRTYAEHQFVGDVLCIATEVGARWSDKIVLDAGLHQYVIGLSSITGIEILPADPAPGGAP